MKLRGKIHESRLDLIMQRYRQDSYELAKTQRNELADLNADRLEVIQKAFSGVGS